MFMQENSFFITQEENFQSFEDPSEEPPQEVLFDVVPNSKDKVSSQMR